MSNTGKMGRSSAIIGSAGVVNKDFLFHFTHYWWHISRFYNGFLYI